MAQMLGLKPSKFSEILNKRMMAGTDVLSILVSKFNISPQWLLTGEGIMLSSNYAQLGLRISQLLTFIGQDFPKSDDLDILDYTSYLLGITRQEIIELTREDILPKSPLNFDKFAERYPEINAKWLKSGIGNMFAIDETAALSSIQHRYEEDSFTRNYVRELKYGIKPDKGVPIYELNNTTDIKSIFVDDKAHPGDYLRIPDLSQVDGAIHVRGESMAPLLKSGDIIIFKIIKPSSLNIIWGQMYLLSFEISDGFYTDIKYIQKADNPDHIRIVSHNSRFEPKDIPLSSIRALALIKASITFHTIE